MGESNLYKELEKWVTHPDFDQAVENFKEKLRNGQKIKKQNEYFYKEITKIIRKYRDGALIKVKAEFPELREELDQQKLWRNQQKTLITPHSKSSNLQTFSNMQWHKHQTHIQGMVRQRTIHLHFHI